MKFGKITQVGEERVSRGQTRPRDKGAGAPASQKKLWDLLRAQYEKQQPKFAW